LIASARKHPSLCAQGIFLRAAGSFAPLPLNSSPDIPESPNAAGSPIAVIHVTMIEQSDSLPGLASPTRWAPILKEDRRAAVAPHLGNYDRERSQFSWDIARGWLQGLPGGRGLKCAGGAGYFATSREMSGPRSHESPKGRKESSTTSVSRWHKACARCTRGGALWRSHRCVRPRGVVVGVGSAIPSHVLSNTQRLPAVGYAYVPLCT
jgi:hypothetical protein